VFSEYRKKSFTELKWPEREFDNSLAAGAETKNDRSIFSTFPRTFIAWFNFSLLYVELFKLPRVFNIGESI